MGRLDLEFFESADQFPHNLIVNYEFNRTLVRLD